MSRARLLALLVALVALAVAVLQRARAVDRLRQDYDEPTYLAIAYTYADMLEKGHWRDVGELHENFEHPPLVKLLYAQALRVSGAPEPDWTGAHDAPRSPDAVHPAFLVTRGLSAAAGVAQVAVVALVSPVGALLLAWDPYHAKYTSEAYLEAVPGLFAALALLAFERARRQGFAPGWTAVAGALLGLSAAGKYPYGLVTGLTFLPFLLTVARRNWRAWAALGASTGAMFFAANPALWSSPFASLWESVAFHWDYSRGEHVVRSAMPWFQPLVYLVDPWLPESEPDIYLTDFNARALPWLALVGLPGTWRERPVWAVGAVVGLGFLLVWNTKWPQYLLLVLPALCVCAGMGVRTLARLGRWLWRRGRPAGGSVSAGA
jgi:hypothetical protein